MTYNYTVIKVKVEIWFDFTCPFSYIAIKSFTKALEKFMNNKDDTSFKKLQHCAIRR